MDESKEPLLPDDIAASQSQTSVLADQEEVVKVGQLDKNGKRNNGLKGRKYATGKRLTGHQWSELIDKLKAGTHTQRQLSKEYGVSINSIILKRKRLGDIKIGQGALDKTTLAAIEKDATKTLEKVNVVGFSAAESARLITEAKRETFMRNERIGKIVEVLINKKLKDGSHNFSLLKDDFKALLDAQTIFKNQLLLTGLCLGFEDGRFESASDLPELTIRKMNEDDIIDIQSRTVDNDSDDVPEITDDDLMDDEDDI